MDERDNKAMNAEPAICCGVLERMQIGWMRLDDGSKCMPYILGHSDSNRWRINHCPSCGAYVRDVIVKV